MMRFCVALLQVAAILSIAGSTRVVEDGVGCPITEGNRTTTLIDLPQVGFDECFVNVGGLDLDGLKMVTELEEPFDNFREFSRKEALIKNCLTTLTTRYSTCLNGTQENQLVLLEDVLMAAYGLGCLDKGEYLFSVMSKVFHVDNDATSAHDDITDCMATAKSLEVDGNSMLGFYRQFKVFRLCLMERVHGHESATWAALNLLSGISVSIRCPHPDNGTLVLCETLDPTPSTEESSCMFKDLNDREQSILETFIDTTSQCLLVNINQIVFANLRTFRNISEFEPFFKIYCQNRQYMRNCARDVSSVSKSCQNETKHQVIEILVDLIESSLESSCKQDGANLATVFNGFINPDLIGLGKQTLKLCGDTFSVGLKRDLKASSRISAKVNLSYNHVLSLRQCILNGSTDDNSFKTVFEALTNDILAAAKCINPVDGENVLCETLFETNH